VIEEKAAWRCMASALALAGVLSSRRSRDRNRSSFRRPAA
jgi:hypothetical protein